MASDAAFPLTRARGGRAGGRDPRRPAARRLATGSRRDLDRHRARGIAGCRERRHRDQPGGGRPARRRRGFADPRARRDVSGRRPRHGPRRGHPDRARRAGQPRRCRRTRVGDPGRRRRARHRGARWRGPLPRADVACGRRDHDRRRHGRGVRRGDRRGVRDRPGGRAAARVGGRAWDRRSARSRATGRRAPRCRATSRRRRQILHQGAGPPPSRIARTCSGSRASPPPGRSPRRSGRRRTRCSRCWTGSSTTGSPARSPAHSGSPRPAASAAERCCPPSRHRLAWGTPARRSKPSSRSTSA